MAQVLDKELLKYWDQLDTSQKKSIVGMIKSFLQPLEKAGRISIEQYNIEIDEAVKRINKGEYISQDDLEKESEKW